MPLVNTAANHVGAKPPALRKTPFREVMMLVVATGDVGMLADVSPDLANSKEDRALHEFVTDFRRTHGIMPTPEAFQQAMQFPLEPGDPAAMGYLFDKAQGLSVMQRMRDALQLGHEKLTQGVRADVVLSGIVAATRECGRICMPAQATTVDGLSRMLREHMAKVRQFGTDASVTLGWPVLDAATGGAISEDLVTLVGYTGMGKSQYLVYMAIQAWLSGKSVVFCTNEMNTLQIGLRFIGHLTGLNPLNLRQGRLSTHMLDAYNELLERGFPDRPPFTFVDGEFGLTVSSLRSHVERLQPDVTYIDAAYLMRPDDSKWRTGHETAAQLEGELKQMARDYQRPIVKTVQFSNDYARERKDEQRAAKRRREGKETERDNSRVRKDPTLDTIGASSAVAKHGSIVIAVEEGDGVYARTTRRMTLMKAREGETGLQWHVNFGHDPVDCGAFNPHDSIPEDELEDWNNDL